VSHSLTDPYTLSMLIWVSHSLADASTTKESV